jgi:hypothetical protein
MGKEEQQEEREVLDSIFPEEITGNATNTLLRGTWLINVFSRHFRD